MANHALVSIVRTPFVALMCAAALVGAGCSDDEDGDKIKIGFIVKQPEETWFRAEWKYAQQAADENGFELMKVGAIDAVEVQKQIDALAVNGAKGFVICTPDQSLGPKIVKLAKKYDMKFMSVDDQLMGKDGKFMTEVPHLGISAKKIGRQVGQALYAEMQKRKWPVADTAVCALTYKDLDTAVERTEGAIEALIKAGFPEAQIHRAQQKEQSTDSAYKATSNLLTNQSQVKHWLLCGMNDLAVRGGVRALSTLGPANVIGIGVNGTDVQGELVKDNAFFGSMLLQPKKHGYDTTMMVYKWISQGEKPAMDTRTGAILIHRGNYEEKLKEQGFWQ